ARHAPAEARNRYGGFLDWLARLVQHNRREDRLAARSHTLGSRIAVKRNERGDCRIQLDRPQDDLMIELVVLAPAARILPSELGAIQPHHSRAVATREIGFPPKGWRRKNFKRGPSRQNRHGIV